MKYTNSWHLLQNDRIMRDLSTDMYKGLSTQEVRRRRLRHGSNNVWRVRTRQTKEILSATLFDLATLLLIISVASAALFDKSYEAGAIAAILVAAGVIRTVTYIRANRIFEDMAREKIPVSSVIRDGTIVTVPATEIVEGDIFFLEAGDIVPCDGRVISGDDAIVSERGITDNKTPVHKFNTVIKTDGANGEVPCEFRSNMLFAGSRVISGSVRAVACGCGKNTLISMKNGGIEIIPAENIPLVERLGKRSKTTSLIMLGCVMVVTWLAMFLREDVTLPEVFLTTMAMAVAAMSEFLTSIGYIIFAITLRDAADGLADGVSESDTVGGTGKKNHTARIIIRDPDKTDLLSRPDIVVFCGSRFFKSGRMELSSYRSKGKLRTLGTADDGRKNDPRPLGELLALASVASAESSTGLSSGAQQVRLSETAGIVSRAVAAFKAATGVQIEKNYAIFDHSAAGDRHSELDCSVIEAGGKQRLVVCGALDAVLRCCTDAEGAHGREKLTYEMKREIFTDCARLEVAGAKVIAVAKRAVDTRFLEPAIMTVGMTFVGFFSLVQETEKETNSDIRSNVKFLIGSGIVPVLLTENPDGDMYYCQRFGLFNRRTVRISAAELDSVDPTMLTPNGLIVSFADIGGVYLANAYENTVKYLRGTGENKRNIIALGGDMWDKGALGEADIGAAVVQAEYKSIPQPLAQKASVVIHPEENTAEAGFGGFSGLIRGIKYARRAIENIDSAKIYITASQTARLVVILASVFTSIPLMSSVFILVWGLLFDFVTALVMAFENNGRHDGYVRRKFMREDEKIDRFRLHEHHTLISMISGAVWGAVIAATVPLARVLSAPLGFEYSSAVGASVMAASVILSGVMFALETMKRDSIFVSHQPNTAQVGYILIWLIFAALMILTDVGAKAAGGVACFAAAVVVLVPAVVVIVVCEIVKSVFISEKNKKKKKR